MSKHQIQINLCYILHTRPYQDNSMIMQCLSREKGLISLLSKGARSSKKQLLSLLQPFQILSVSYTGKGDLYILTGVELYKVEHHYVSNPLLSGKAIYCAYYVNELLLRLIPPEEVYPELFNLYQHTLYGLKKDSYEIALRNFEIRLLTIIGYQLNLQYDIHTGKEIEANKKYYYDPLSGPYEISNNELNINNYQNVRISGQTLIAIKTYNFENLQVLKESKYLLRQVLQSHLGDKPLNSRVVYKQLYCL